MLRFSFVDEELSNMKIILTCNLKNSKRITDKKFFFNKVRKSCLSELLLVENNINIYMC